MTSDTSAPYPFSTGARNSSMEPLYGCAEDPKVSTVSFRYKTPGVMLQWSEDVRLGTATDPIQIVPSTGKGITQTFQNNMIQSMAFTVPSSRVAMVVGSSDSISIAIEASDGVLVSTQWYDVILPQGLVTDTTGACHTLYPLHAHYDIIALLTSCLCWHFGHATHRLVFPLPANCSPSLGSQFTNSFSSPPLPWCTPSMSCSSSLNA